MVLEDGSGSIRDCLCSVMFNKSSLALTAVSV